MEFWLPSRFVPVAFIIKNKYSIFPVIATQPSFDQKCAHSFAKCRRARIAHVSNGSNRGLNFVFGFIVINSNLAEYVSTKYTQHMPNVWQICGNVFSCSLTGRGRLASCADTHQNTTKNDELEPRTTMIDSICVARLTIRWCSRENRKWRQNKNEWIDVIVNFTWLKSHLCFTSICHRSVCIFTFPTRTHRISKWKSGLSANTDNSIHQIWYVKWLKTQSKTKKLGVHV